MTTQFGPHRYDAGEYGPDHTDAYRDADFTVVDLSGQRFVDCDLSGVKIVDGWLVGVDVSGYVERLVVNGVDVTEYVEAELDRRHPERVQLREIGSAADFQAMWTTLETLWAGAVERAERLPVEQRYVQVDEEWSFVQTLRHLVFITDAWLSRPVLGEERPYHPLGLPQTAYSRTAAAELGIDVRADPTYAEALAARADRMALVRRTVDGLADEDLGRLCSLSPAPGYPEEDRPVAECLAVVMEEEVEHYRFAVRDLAVLESRTSS